MWEQRREGGQTGVRWQSSMLVMDQATRVDEGMGGIMKEGRIKVT